MTNATTLQHTPAPWHVDDEHGSLVIRNGGLIADVGPAHKEANAKLLAASPDLLEACMTFERWLRREEAGLALPEGCERDSVEGKRIFQAWWDENLNLCRKAQTQARTALKDTAP